MLELFKMKISNTSINKNRINEIKNSNSTTKAMTIFERVKDWFGIGKERQVIDLIKNIFYETVGSSIDKVYKFCDLYDLAGEQYENNFKVSYQDNKYKLMLKLDIKKYKDLEISIDENEIKNTINWDISSLNSTDKIDIFRSYRNLFYIKEAMNRLESDDPQLNHLSAKYLSCKLDFDNKKFDSLNTIFTKMTAHINEDKKINKYKTKFKDLIVNISSDSIKNSEIKLLDDKKLLFKNEIYLLENKIKVLNSEKNITIDNINKLKNDINILLDKNLIELNKKNLSSMQDNLLDIKEQIFNERLNLLDKKINLSEFTLNILKEDKFLNSSNTNQEDKINILQHKKVLLMKKIELLINESKFSLADANILNEKETLYKNNIEMLDLQLNLLEKKSSLSREGSFVKNLNALKNREHILNVRKDLSTNNINTLKGKVLELNYQKDKNISQKKINDLNYEIKNLNNTIEYNNIIEAKKEGVSVASKLDRINTHQNKEKDSLNKEILILEDHILSEENNILKAKQNQLEREFNQFSINTSNTNISLFQEEIKILREKIQISEVREDLTQLKTKLTAEKINQLETPEQKENIPETVMKQSVEIISPTKIRIVRKEVTIEKPLTPIEVKIKRAEAKIKLAEEKINVSKQSIAILQENIKIVGEQEKLVSIQRSKVDILSEQSNLLAKEIKQLDPDKKSVAITDLELNESVFNDMKLDTNYNFENELMSLEEKDEALYDDEVLQTNRQNAFDIKAKNTKEEERLLNISRDNMENINNEIQEMGGVAIVINTINNNKITYRNNINSEFLIDNIFDSAKGDNIENIVNQVVENINELDLFFDGKKLTDINSLDNETKDLSEENKKIFYKMIGGDIFSLIKDSFDKYDPIISNFSSSLKNKKKIEINHNKDDSYSIIVKDQKLITKENVNQILPQLNNSLTDFDYYSMTLLNQYFDDGTSSLFNEVKNYQRLLTKSSDEVDIKHHFNFDRRKYLLDEDLNVKFNFNPKVANGLQLIVYDDSHCEYSLLKNFS